MIRKFYKVALLSMFSFSCFSGNAQHENANWYFGNNAGLRFTASGPIALTDGVSFGHDGTAVVSNRSGELSFYSNGETVWNRNHLVMANGSGLLGSPTSTHAAVAILKPGSTKEYFLFTTDRSGYSNGLRYHTIDMSLQSGMGEVVSKNNLLQTPVTEKIIGVRHSNGIDAWLLAHEFNSNSFIAYHVTSTGISAAPVVSSVGPIHGPGDALAQGQMKASANGTKLALGVYGGHRFELYDFNPATGEVTNPEVISGETNAYGVEFSPNGQFLYTSNLNFNSVNQFDLLAGNNQSIIASKVTVGSATTPPSVNPYKVASLQIGPDQKVYVSKWESPYLAVINNPDLSGLQSGFVDDGVYLGGKLSLGGFPNPVLGLAMPTSSSKPIEGTVKVFPNPANGEVNISFAISGSPTGAEIVVKDMLGRSFYAGSITSNKQMINVANWAKGVYLVQVNQNGYFQTSRLVVE